MKDFFRRLHTNLNRIYRVSFIDDETLSQTRQHMLKPITVILIGLLLLITVIGGTASLIVFTPSIRENIPGYLDPEFDKRGKLLIAENLELKRTIEERDSMFIAYGLIADWLGSGRTSEGSASSVEEVPSDPVSPQLPASQGGAIRTQIIRDTVYKEVLKVVYQPGSDGAASSTHSGTLLNLYRPVKGFMRNPFSREDKHYGIDIVSDDKDATIYSATDGSVIVSEYSDNDGHVIGIANKGDIVTFYKHNSSLLKKVGSPVLAGEAIAIIGNSGENTSGPHLHFELWFQGIPVDPMDYYASFE